MCLIIGEKICNLDKNFCMKTILITGATGGIGQKLIEHLIKDNNIIALDRNNKKLAALVKRINDKKLTAKLVDVTSKKIIKKTFSSIKNLDVLINCAGLLRPVGLFLENNLEEWKKTLEVNLLGTVYCCYFAISLLLKSKRGKIINFSGGGSAYPRPYHTAYATSKAAVVRFTETIAAEYPTLDINVIAPGNQKTNLWKDEKADRLPKEWGDINRLIDFIDYLISEKSNGITGKFIHYKDDWENFDPKKLSKNIYVLRRIEK